MLHFQITDIVKFQFLKNVDYAEKQEHLYYMI